MPIRTEATHYGYRSTISDPLSPDEDQTWVNEVLEAVRGRDHFGQLIDMRGRARLTGDPHQERLIADMMTRLRAQGLLRSAVILSSRQVALKIKQLAFATGLYEWERYLDGTDPDCEARALDWVERGIDPDDWAQPASPGPGAAGVG